MSDYYGTATLESWLIHECFLVDSVPNDVVSLFEKWRGNIESRIQAWMDSDEGYGRASWRDWSYNLISDYDQAEFDTAVETGKKIIDIAIRDGKIESLLM